MNAFLGQVPADVRSLAAELEAKASDIEALISEVTTRFQSTSWRGADRDAFEGSWNGEMTANLQHLAGALRDAGTIATNNADQQELASS